MRRLKAACPRTFAQPSLAWCDRWHARAQAWARASSIRAASRAKEHARTPHARTRTRACAHARTPAKKTAGEFV
eukprot:7855235-Alexandrium_andersonii.AAC.1